AARVVAIRDAARVEEGVDARHFDVPDGEGDVVRDERSARGARALEGQVSRSDLEVALRRRRVPQQCAAKHRGEESSRALYLRHVELDVIDRVELGTGVLGERASGRE